MSGECDKCGEHALECICIYDVWKDIDIDNIWTQEDLDEYAIRQKKRNKQFLDNIKKE